jgi:hypothetical protein
VQDYPAGYAGPPGVDAVAGVNVRFVEMANPHSWLLAADNLHLQALLLYSRQGQSTLTLTDFKAGVVKTWDSTNKAVFLLGGFALENAIKAFLVYENPHWISNGKLSKRLRSHSLTKLQKQSSLIPFKNRHLGVLEQFEEGLESWARYPCGLSLATSMVEGIMQHDLWSGYIRLMRA